MSKKKTLKGLAPNKKTNRVRQEDVEQSIFRPQANVVGDHVDRDFFKNPEREVIVYTIFGQHDDLDEAGCPLILDADEQHLAEDNPRAFAKSVKLEHKNTKYYYIKRTANGFFFNPSGIDEGNQIKFANHAGRKVYEFSEVNKKVFTFYLQFLKTKNTAHLRRAERETR